MRKSGKSRKRPRASDQKPGVIVLGLDENGKPRAARFPGSLLAAIKRAAKQMNMVAIQITPEISGAAKKLPSGRVSPNGSVSVAPVRTALFNKLLALSGADLPGSVSDKNPFEINSPPSLPRDWSEIDVGHHVLAEPNQSGLGWWPAEVIARTNETLTLRWRDAPKDPKIIRQRTAVALLNPEPSQNARVTAPE